MFVVHATKKLRTRLTPAPMESDQASSTILGPWYATAVFWQPQIALFVNETTLLPLLLPLAPGSTLTDRFPLALSTVLTAHGVSDSFITEEISRMDLCRVLPTSNRSVVGIMTEFTFLAEATRAAEPDLLDIALWLARTPCSPLYSKHTSPDRELGALLGQELRRT